MSKILLVEDDSDLAGSIKYHLEFQGHTVDWVNSAEEAQLHVELSTFELLILDWQLPGISGIEFLKTMRAAKGTLVLMLTGRTNSADKVVGLDAGADDYLTKPFDVNELTARVRAMLRRPHNMIADRIIIGQLVIDLDRRNCQVGGVPVPLNAGEFSLLEFFVRHPGHVFSVDAIFERVWRADSESGVDAVRQCMTRLRKKLRLAGSPNIIRTVIGSGYQYDDANTVTDQSPS